MEEGSLVRPERGDWCGRQYSEDQKDTTRTLDQKLVSRGLTCTDTCTRESSRLAIRRQYAESLTSTNTMGLHRQGRRYEPKGHCPCHPYGETTGTRDTPVSDLRSTRCG